MRKNIFLILLVAAIFVFVGTVPQSAKAVDDPVQFIKNAKTPVHFHSMAGGVTCIPGISDSLIHHQANVLGTWWHSIYPPVTFSAFWKVKAQIENGIFGLNTSDKLKIGYYNSYPPGTPGDSLWVHVENVTITLVLERHPTHADTMYVEFERGWNRVDSNFVNFAISNILPQSVVCDTLHEVWPVYSPRYHLSSWTATAPPHDSLRCCDIIDLTNLETMEVSDWHVIDVAIDIEVLSIPDPTVPTMTQWGIIILVALLIGSGVFVMLRRRKVAVPA